VWRPPVRTTPGQPRGGRGCEVPRRYRGPVSETLPPSTADRAAAAPSTGVAGGSAPAAERSAPGSVAGSAAGGLVRRVGGAVVRRLATGDGTFERPPLSDALLAGVLAALAVAAYASAGADTPSPALGPAWFGWVLLPAIHVPLVWRRVTPTLTIALTGTATGVFYLLGYDAGSASLAVLVALYSVTAYGTRQDGVVAAVVSGCFVTAGLLVAAAQGIDLGPVEVVLNYGIFVTAWALGERTRTRRDLVAQLTLRADEAERSRELATRLAVSDERARIARELHDLVAHTVSVMVVQAGGGRRAAERDAGRAAEALGAVEATGRAALGELRRMVGVLRDPDSGVLLSPQPGLDAVQELVARVGDAGLPVRLTVTGTPRDHATVVELTAYRLVQEALTNVLKHAGTVRRVEVRLHHAECALELHVRDDGRGAGLDRDAPGTGLLGMRERVALVGGTLTTGPRVGGGFEVRAVLPDPSRRRAD
jgi:signal transduction histidine kinase